MADDIPDGFTKNTREQNEMVERCMKAAAVAVGTAADEVVAIAVVLATKDGNGFAGDLSNVQVMARLLVVAPENLRQTIQRALEGKGKTIVVPMWTPKPGPKA